jgi:hypothetical protein
VIRAKLLDPNAAPDDLEVLSGKDTHGCMTNEDLIELRFT